MSEFGYYKDGEKPRGPFSTSELKRLASEGDDHGINTRPLWQRW